MPKRTAIEGVTDPGNYVSEWFGFRVYPTVATGKRSVETQREGNCPFLSRATEERRGCIKSESSSGVCTISSCSNGPRQDWLVCPYRALDTGLFVDVARRLFNATEDRKVTLVPAPTLAKPAIRKRVRKTVAEGGVAIVYLQGKLGGEITLAPTDRSPELSFDTTMVELTDAENTGLSIGRYGIFEVQTMDFHGSYRHAVKNLKDALRLHGNSFPDVLRENRAWLSDRIEGPNIANVFKRTFYQMMLKFKIGEHRLCAGCAIAIPSSVWDSWQRHLGKPELVSRTDGTMVLKQENAPASRAPAWIFVFDVDAESRNHPNPISIKRIIATDAESLAHYAFRVVPDAAVAEGGSADRILSSIRYRLAAWWPEIATVLEM